MGNVANVVRAAHVLHKRGMVELTRPAAILHSWWMLRRYGAFGGLAAHAAARYVAAPAITDDDGTVGFDELESRSNALARALADTGIGPDAGVGVLSRPHHGVLLTLMAANKIGARTVLLNTGFAAPQLVEVCARERVSVVVADPEFAGLLDGLPPEVVRVRSVAELSAGHSPRRPPAPARPGGMVLLTSGTTGTPKGAPRDRLNPLQSAQLLDRVPWARSDVYVVAAPLFHATGLATCTVGLALGNRVVLARRFDPEATLAAIDRHRASVLVLVPTMLSRILDLGPDVLNRYDTSRLRVVFAAGSSLSPELCRRTADTFGDVLYNLYGSTEVATAAVATPADLRAAPGTVGRPPIGCRLAVYDEQDRLITEPGRVGTLYVSSGLSFGGYTDGSRKKTLDGMLCTGDTGHFDPAGRWFVDGRADDMIVSGGENVYPLEVENLLAAHPGIVEAAVTGVADADFGQRLSAVVVAHPDAGLDADSVRDFVRSRLARHKVPRDVVFVEALPRNETGKVVKSRLP